MKKKLIIIGILLAIGIALVAIPRSTYEAIFGNKDIAPQENTYQYHQIVYVVSENNQLVGLKVGVSAIEEDQIMQKWNLLTKNVNALPTNYASPLLPTTTLESYHLEDGVLALNVNEDIINARGKMAVSSIAWTFCDGKDINEIVIKVNDEEITMISDYHFKKINKDIVVNYSYETAYLFEANHATVIYYQEDVIKPVTYFYQNEDEIDYVINKIFNENVTISDQYDYLLSADALTVNLGLTDNLNDNTINTLVNTLAYNYDVDTITVNGLNDVIYKTVSVVQEDD